MIDQGREAANSGVEDGCGVAKDADAAAGDFEFGERRRRAAEASRWSGK